VVIYFVVKIYIVDFISFTLVMGETKLCKASNQLNDSNDSLAFESQHSGHPFWSEQPQLIQNMHKTAFTNPLEMFYWK